MSEREPYLVLEVDCSDTGSIDDEDNLTETEWKSVKAIFKRHLKLISITCPERHSEFKDTCRT